MPDITDLYNFLPLSNHLLTSGQPTEEQYPAIAAAGVRTVVNLALTTSDHALPDEAGLASSLGMDYIHIPVVWENPTKEDFDRFVAVMDSLQGRKVLVHCVANMRVTAFVALYRILHLGWEREAAFRQVYPIWDPAADAVWQPFIDALLEKG